MIKVNRFDNGGALVSSSEESDYALLGAMYIWIDSKYKDEAETHQRNVFSGNPYYVCGFDLMASDEVINKFITDFQDYLEVHS